MTYRNHLFPHCQVAPARAAASDALKLAMESQDMGSEARRKRRRPGTTGTAAGG